MSKKDTKIEELRGTVNLLMEKLAEKNKTIRKMIRELEGGSPNQTVEEKGGEEEEGCGSALPRP